MESSLQLALIVVLAILVIVALVRCPRPAQAFVAAAVVLGGVAVLAARVCLAAPRGAAASGGDEDQAADAPGAAPEDAADPAAAAVPDLADFAQVDATRYSSPRPDHARQEICYFRRLDPARKFERVIDATAHVGVDTHVLAQAYGCRVDAVEFVAETFKALKANVAKFAVPGVVAVNASAADYLKTAGRADLVYLDPPWGGPGYKRASDLPLYDAKGDRSVPLGPVVDQALEVAPVVVLKVPHNFNYEGFEQKTKGHVVSVARIKYPSAQYRKKRAVFLMLEIRREAVREC